MYSFASLTATEFMPFVGILSAMLIAFYGLLKFILNQAEKERKAEREERKDFAKALKGVAEASTRVAEATEQAAREAKERNGHLAELSLQSQEMFKKLADRNFDAITKIKTQHVVNQTVENETVVKKGE